MRYTTTSVALFLFAIAQQAALSQNYAVLLAKDFGVIEQGFPTNWPVFAQPIGSAETLPPQYQQPWQHYTGEQLEQLKSILSAAKELWNQVQGTRDERKRRVGQLFQERIESGQWEPARLRLHALESELFGKVMQVTRLNCELLLLVTKAVAPSALTNNLTAPERSRVAALRPQLSFAQAPDLTQQDRDRVIFITAELSKIEALWKEARELRSNIETNLAYVDPSTLGTVTIGE